VEGQAMGIALDLGHGDSDGGGNGVAAQSAARLLFADNGAATLEQLTVEYGDGSRGFAPEVVSAGVLLFGLDPPPKYLAVSDQTGGNAAGDRRRNASSIPDRDGSLGLAFALSLPRLC